MTMSPSRAIANDHPVILPHVRTLCIAALWTHKPRPDHYEKAIDVDQSTPRFSEAGDFPARRSSGLPYRIQQGCTPVPIPPLCRRSDECGKYLKMLNSSVGFDNISANGKGSLLSDANIKPRFCPLIMGDRG